MHLKLIAALCLIVASASCTKRADPVRSDGVTPTAVAISPVTEPMHPQQVVASAEDSSAVTPSSPLECAKQGGTWRRAGMLQLEVCDIPTKDAGKPCSNGSECESLCVAPDGANAAKPVTGQCYRSTITVGTCLSKVEGGRIASAQCSD